MKTVTKKLSELKHPKVNVRMHSDKQIAEFRRSVEMFGQIRPIVCDENGVILAGNGLYDTLVSMGREEADCYIVSGLTENEKKKLMIADNRVFDLGVDDMRAFDQIIAELGDDLDVPGFDDELLQSLNADSSDVDGMMSSYGLIDEGKKEQIREAAETYREEAAQRSAPTLPEAAPMPDVKIKEVEPKTETEQRYILCPHCGEKIWL